MSLLLKTTKIKINDDDDDKKNSYEITNEDIELAQELGLLNPIDHFEVMIDNEEEFYDDVDKFIDELEISESPMWFEIEGIYTNNHIYYNIPVRIISISDHYAFGSIDGDECVYIPKSLLHNISLNELVSINLIYKESGINSWKAIKINNKKDYKPVLINSLIIGDEEFNYIQNTYHIPFQDIGKMIGKNGYILKKVIKNYLFNNPEDLNYFNPEPIDWNNFEEWYEDANIPILNINNVSDDYTEIKLYYKSIIKFKGKIKFDPITDYIMKLYY